MPLPAIQLISYKTFQADFTGLDNRFFTPYPCVLVLTEVHGTMAGATGGLQLSCRPDDGRDTSIEGIPADREIMVLWEPGWWIVRGLRWGTGSGTMNFECLVMPYLEAIRTGVFPTLGVCRQSIVSRTVVTAGPAATLLTLSQMVGLTALYLKSEVDPIRVRFGTTATANLSEIIPGNTVRIYKAEELPLGQLSILTDAALNDNVRSVRYFR